MTWTRPASSPTGWASWTTGTSWPSTPPKLSPEAFPGSSTLDVAAAGVPPESAAELLGALAALEGVERADPVDDSATAASQGRVRGRPDRGRSPEVRVRLYVTGDAASMVAPVARLLNSRQASLTDVRLGSPSLEDVFIHLTGRSLR